MKTTLFLAAILGSIAISSAATVSINVQSNNVYNPALTMIDADGATSPYKLTMLSGGNVYLNSTTIKNANANDYSKYYENQIALASMIADIGHFDYTALAGFSAMVMQHLP